MMKNIFAQNQKTFRPKKKHPEGRRTDLHNQAKATLGAGDHPH
jgi:hypothetical protein